MNIWLWKKRQKSLRPSSKKSKVQQFKKFSTGPWQHSKRMCLQKSRVSIQPTRMQQAMAKIPGKSTLIPLLRRRRKESRGGGREEGEEAEAAAIQRLGTSVNEVQWKATIRQFPLSFAQRKYNSNYLHLSLSAQVENLIHPSQLVADPVCSRLKQEQDHQQQLPH